MGIVTDVNWNCPGCGTVNNAQLYDDYYPPYDEDYNPISHKQLPYGVSLKWNPPCEKCKEYQLKDPSILVDLPIIKLNSEE